MAIRVELPAGGWRPRAYQRGLWGYLERGGTRAVAIWHRRAGKDDVALHWGACSCVKRVGVYWHMLPEAAQARKAIWDAINPKTGKRRIDEAFPRVLRAVTREQEMSIRFRNGSIWQVVGSDNYDSLVGAPPVGIVYSEWALADPLSWAYLRPILAENGGWALFITTPRGRNHAATFYDFARSEPGWFAERLPATETDVFDATALARERREYVAQFGPLDGETRYRQEYLCDFDAPVVGSYYGAMIGEAEAEGRVGPVAHDPALSVETWWDLGIGDSTAIWFAQRFGGEARLIDYHEASGESLQYYAALLQQWARPRAAGGKSYIYDRHVLPHDAAARELGTGRSREETLRTLGVAGEVQPRHAVEDGIQAVRTLLPVCYFDAARCQQGLEALRQYRREWDDARRAFRMRPLHDWTSHAADAFRTGAMYRPVRRRLERVTKAWPDLAIV